ncbi:hypothetical protein PM082_015247 [Marasmius tenuissimus]|nr:hypothetical protein PM082_015247 [Marasmius tenuissimus]
MASNFSNARRTTIGANATIQTVAGDAITNIYNNPESGDRVTLYGRTFMRNLQTETSSLIGIGKRKRLYSTTFYIHVVLRSSLCATTRRRDFRQLVWLRASGLRIPQDW